MVSTDGTLAIGPPKLLPVDTPGAGTVLSMTVGPTGPATRQPMRVVGVPMPIIAVQDITRALEARCVVEMSCPIPAVEPFFRGLSAEMEKVWPGSVAASQDAPVERKLLPRVPQRLPELKKWVETWRAVERPWRDLKNPSTGKPMENAYKELSAWLKGSRPAFACSPETLADIIKAGEAGLLEHMPK